VPVRDEGFVGSQQLPRLRCQAHVENVETITVHVMSLPKLPNVKLTKPSQIKRDEHASESGEPLGADDLPPGFLIRAGSMHDP
jgi:hypothetical protein